MRFGEKGVTLVELIVVVSLFFVVLPLIWYYINSSIEDSANINNKIVVQTSVNQLMNNMQKHIQEASLPITTSGEDIDGEAAKIAEDGVGSGGSITLNKPNDITVTYKYDPDTASVTYTMRDEDGVVDTAEFNYIVKFVVKRMENEQHKIGGLYITAVGRIDDKSNYTLTNEYYTRNTM